MGCLCTYASYFKKDTNLTKTAFSVSIIDTFVAILAGLIIFPAAFSVGIQPDAGPSLIFITLPNVFQQAFSGVPLLAYIFSVMFYILLAVAALIPPSLCTKCDGLSARGIPPEPETRGKLRNGRLYIFGNLMFSFIGSR